MVRCLGAVLVCCAWGWSLGGLAIHAQELRVYTKTSQLSPGAERPEVVARSLTLFHAGKVYDYIDALGEVTIFEPAHHRFTILNRDSGTFAIVSRDEVRRFLSLAEEGARQVVTDLLRSPDPQQKPALEFIEFQLEPVFDARYDEATKRLRLQSPHLIYDVTCAASPQPPIVDAYLRYADAMAELNAVLHPQSLLPGPRQAMNEELRRRHVLPVQVRRTLPGPAMIELTAEHEWRWSLSELERQYIANWEGDLTKGRVRQTPFEQMQRAVLSGKVTQR
jgi:hypothetical protein